MGNECRGSCEKDVNSSSQMRFFLWLFGNLYVYLPKPGHHPNSGMEVLGLQVQWSRPGMRNWPSWKSMLIFSPRNKDVFACLLPKRFPPGIGKIGTSFKFCEIKHPGFCFVSFGFFWACVPSSTRSSRWESVFPYQIPGAEAKGPFFSPLYNPLPLPQYTHHCKAFADVATCPHEYASFVHWEAQILCKELLLYHLAICEFFSSLDVCKKAEFRRARLEPFISNTEAQLGVWGYSEQIVVYFSFQLLQKIM